MVSDIPPAVKDIDSVGTELRKFEPELIPDVCPECDYKYDQPIDYDLDLNAFFPAAGETVETGLPGSGKTHCAWAWGWALLHVRVGVEWWIVSNCGFEEITSVVERKKIFKEQKVVDGKEVVVDREFVDRIVDGKGCDPPHPRIKFVDSIADLLLFVAETMRKAADPTNPRTIRILLIVDEGQVSSGFQGKATGGGSGAALSTQGGMLALLGLARKLYLHTFIISPGAGENPEGMIAAKLRAEGPSSVGLVTAQMSKDPSRIREILESLKAQDPSTDWSIPPGITMKQLVAVEPRLSGWGPSVKIVPETPLCRDRNSSPVGTKTFSTLRISGLKAGFVRSPVDGRQVPLNVGRLIGELTEVEVSEIADTITRFISQEVEQSEETDDALAKYGLDNVHDENESSSEMSTGRTEYASDEPKTLRQVIDGLVGSTHITSLNKLAAHLVQEGLISSRGKLYALEKDDEVNLSAWRSTQKPKVGEVDEEQ